MRQASTCHPLSLRPPNTFITSITPLSSNTYLALSSDDTLSLFTPEAIHTTLHTSHSTTRATSLLDTQILTAGDDKQIKLWDPRTSVSTQTLSVSAPVLSLASNTNIIAAGTELANREAILYLFDTRNPAFPVRFVESHSDDIVSLTLHPQQPVLISGGSDGLVNAYDTRIAEEDDALMRVWNLEAGVNRAGFLGGGEMVWGLSCDERFAVWNLEAVEQGEEGSEGGEGEWVFGDLRPVLECDYVVDVLETSSGAVVCAGRFGMERLDLVPLRQTPAWTFLGEETVRLGSGLGEEIVRCMVVDDENECVLTGSEDNIVRIWSGFA